MSWIYNTFFSWIEKVDEYRNNHGKSKFSNPSVSQHLPSQKIEYRFNDNSLNKDEMLPETDLMIADLVPPHHMKRSKTEFLNKYYISWHLLTNQKKIPGVPNILMFNTFDDCLKEFEKRICAPLGEKVVYILWSSSGDSLKKLQIGSVSNYKDYKNSVGEIDLWVKNNMYNAIPFTSL